MERRRLALALIAATAVQLAAVPAVMAQHVRVEGELLVPAPVIAPGPPPPLREEAVPPPPGPPERVVWAPGHWEWNGRSHFWVGGHYIERPEVGLVWEPGRWEARHGHWAWIGGHWRR